MQGVENDRDGLSLFYLVATSNDLVLFRSDGPCRSRALQTKSFLERRVDVLELLQVFVANRLASTDLVHFSSDGRVGSRGLEQEVEEEREKARGGLPMKDAGCTSVSYVLLDGNASLTSWPAMRKVTS